MSTNVYLLKIKLNDQIKVNQFGLGYGHFKDAITKKISSVDLSSFKELVSKLEFYTLNEFKKICSSYGVQGYDDYATIGDFDIKKIHPEFFRNLGMDVIDLINDKKTSKVLDFEFYKEFPILHWEVVIDLDKSIITYYEYIKNKNIFVKRREDYL